MSTVGHRLEEERKKLGFNQTQFGEIAGVSRKTQGNYESNERRADSEYLAAIAKAGADITYIVLGTKPNVYFEKRAMSSTDKASSFSVRESVDPQYNYENEPFDLEVLEIAIECIELYIDELDLKVTPAKKAKVIRMLYPLIRDDDNNEVPDNVIDLLKLAAEIDEEGETDGQQKEKVADGHEGTSRRKISID